MVAANSINESTTGITGFTGTAFVGTTVTNHGIVLGGATSSTLGNVGPSATAGQILRSGGAAADPAFSTATYPATAGTSGKILISDGTNIVSSTPTYPNAAGTSGKVIASDGTNFVTSTATFPVASATSGKIIQSDGTNWLASTPTYPLTAGTSGKILISDGTNIVSSTPTYPNAASTALKHIKSDGTNFVTTTVTYPDASVTAGKVIVSDGTNYIASTPTFPNASATTRKMIVSDGTNWVASTETWAVPGTTGNLLTSDGTNWTSATPIAAINVAYATKVLTSAQVKALHTTAIEVIAAPGAGKVIVPIAVVTYKLTYGGTNAFTGGGTVSIYWGTGTALGAAMSSITGTASIYDFKAIATTATSAIANHENLAVNLFNNGSAFTGNAANNNTVTVALLYYITNI